MGTASADNYYVLAASSGRVWRKLLHTNRGLFKRIPVASPSIRGPSLDSEGKITGENFGMEAYFFMQHATPEQQKFKELLDETNLHRSEEYVLNITGALEKWKRNMKVLKQMIVTLQLKEKKIREEEAEIAADQKTGTATVKEHQPHVKEFLDFLEEHFPRLYNQVNLPVHSLSELVKQLQEILHSVKGERDYLRQRVAAEEKERPFLFR